MNAARLLARGWRTGARRWYMATVAVLAATLLLLLVVSGLLVGMQRETESRVADFYTGDLRLTPTAATRPIPPGTFHDVAVPGASLHFESQFILRRHSLVGAATEPGQVQLGSDAGVALGGLIGYTDGSPAARAMAAHIVVGRLPSATDGSGPLPLVMGQSRFASLLSDAEREAITWPPSVTELATYTFEVTAAVVPGDQSLEEAGDVIRRPARLVGLFDTGVDLLDSLTFLAPIEDVRRLHGIDAGEPVGNVLIVHGDTGPARAHAAAQGWGTRGAATFTDEHLGQLMDVVRGLSLFAAVVLFILPAFLVTHGLTRQLETHQREVAVCRAIGVPGGEVRGALGLLVARILILALAAGAVGTVLVALALARMLPGADTPLPVTFQVSLLVVVGTAAVALTTCLVAYLAALRAAHRLDVATALRTF